MTENEIIQGCLKNDTKAQRLLFQQYSGILMTICRRYAGDQPEAEDILQEAFIRIFRYMNQYKYAGSFVGWIKRITVNTAIKILQTRKIKFSEITGTEAEIQTQDRDIFSDLSADELIKLISRLPDGYRIVFNLYIIEGYSHDEIARILHIQTATSRSQLSKARTMLKEKIISIQKIPG